VWEGAVVTRSYKQADDVILITSESGELREVKIRDKKDLPPLRNPQILIGQNDLTALSYLNEPDVLSCLEVR
jgi:myosin V